MPSQSANAPWGIFILEDWLEDPKLSRCQETELRRGMKRRAIGGRDPYSVCLDPFRADGAYPCTPAQFGYSGASRPAAERSPCTISSWINVLGLPGLVPQPGDSPGRTHSLRFWRRAIQSQGEGWALPRRGLLPALPAAGGSRRSWACGHMAGLPASASMGPLLCDFSSLFQGSCHRIGGPPG